MFLIIGDPHFKLDNSESTNILHSNTISIILERKIKYVIILGDVLHRHEKIDMNCYDRVEKYLEDIHNTGVEIFLLIGNHDRSSNKVYMTNEHVFNSLKLWDRTYIIDTCQVFERDEIKFCCMPYVPNDMFLKALDDCNIKPIEDNIDVVFCHSEFKGCKINNMSKSKCDEYPLNFPLNIAGHIHDYEVVQENLIYLGTPFQQTYGEKPDKAIFQLSFNKDTDTITNLTNNRSYILDKIKLSIPTKIYVTIKVEDLYRFQMPIGDVKIKIVGPILEVKRLLKSPDLVEKYKNAKIVYSDITITKVKEVENRCGSFGEKLITTFKQDNQMIDIFNNIFSS